MVQRLRLRASTAGGTGSSPGWGTKILHVDLMCCVAQPKKMHLKLKDQQLKTIMYIYRLLTANQKSTIDIYTKKERNPNITLKIVIKS